MFVIKTPFTRVNIGSWQEKDLSIFQTQQECGENIPEVVVGSGMILEMGLVEGQQINSLGFPKGLQGCDILSWDPLGLGQRTEAGTSPELVLQALYNTFSISAPARPGVSHLLLTWLCLETSPALVSPLPWASSC